MEDPLVCHVCGAPLGLDPDDDETGGPSGQPLCGECVRNRDEAAELERLDMADGQLDGLIDL